MNLNPSTVELVLKRASIGVLPEDSFQCLGHFSEHRFYWDEEMDADPLQFFWTSSYSDLCNVSNVTVQHVCSAHQFFRSAGSEADRVLDYSFDHTDPHLSKHHPYEIFRLYRTRLGEECLD